MGAIKLIKNILFKTFIFFYKHVYRLISVDNKTILFISFHGRGYICNPKYIHLTLKEDERFKDFKHVWALKNKNQTIEGAEVIKYRGIKYFYYLSKSKFWISNCKLPEYCLKKDEQIYIQCWHGTPLKKLAHDIDLGDDKTFYRTKLNKSEMLRTYDIDVKKYNYLLSPNRYSTDIFKSCFKIDKSKIRELGYPRNDFLVNLTQNDIKKIKDQLNINYNKKILLYAPTWRDNHYNTKGYIFNLNVNFKKWKEVLEDEWVVIYKPHYLIVNSFDNKGLEDFIYVFKEDYDINFLYAISDLLVTDYSSVFFDYAILNRPMIFYMYDLNEYKEELRGLYLDIYKDLPGPIVEHEGELLKHIKNYDKIYKDYKNKIKIFSEFYNEFDDGQAAKKVIENLIIPHLSLDR